MEQRYYREVHDYDSSRKPWKGNGEKRWFQMKAAFNLHLRGSREVYDNIIGFSKAWTGDLTPNVREQLLHECRISARVSANILGSTRHPVDDDKTETLWSKVIVYRQMKPLPEGKQPKPLKEPARMKVSTGIVTARNGRRYIPLQKNGLNYAWKDVKTGETYSNGMYARVLNKEGADQSKAKPLKRKA